MVSHYHADDTGQDLAGGDRLQAIRGADRDYGHVEQLHLYGAVEVKLYLAEAAQQLRPEEGVNRGRHRQAEKPEHWYHRAPRFPEQQDHGRAGEPGQAAEDRPSYGAQQFHPLEELAPGDLRIGTHRGEGRQRDRHDYRLNPATVDVDQAVSPAELAGGGKAAQPSEQETGELGAKLADEVARARVAAEAEDRPETAE